MNLFEKILVLGAHPDDGELSCGATIKKLTQSGKQVWYAVFSPCKKSVPEGFDDDILYKELVKAVSHLGIPPERLIKYDFEVREFPSKRQEILEKLVELKKKISPELVILPCSFDFHQDHQVIRNEGERAFKHCSLLGYDLPWNYTQSNFNFFSSVTAEQLNAKTAALEEYHSQGFRNYVDSEFIKSLAKVRGVQGAVAFAEAFELIRWVNK